MELNGNGNGNGSESESHICLHKVKANKPYSMRILKVDNICIDEDHVFSSVSQTPKLEESILPVETHALSAAEKLELETLYEANNAYIAAKSAYEAAAETFWKSPTGLKLETILAPDPKLHDRAPLLEKTKILDSYLVAESIQIKKRRAEVSGYNYIIATYILVMYETQTLPRNYNDFTLQTIKEQIVHEIPKVWSNRVAIKRKKVVDCVYVYGHVLPPYRLKDMQ